jgi:hypothetical protein
MSHRHLMGRRQFLKVSSTTAVAAAVLGPKLFAGEVTAPKRLAVGFASLEASAVLMAASSIPASDGTFIGRGARITASGASQVAGRPSERRVVELVTHFSYFDGAELKTAPFTAWACSRTTGCQGNSVAFNVPVDETQKVTFSVSVEKGIVVSATGVARTTRRRAVGGPSAANQAQALPLILSLQNEPGSVRLARGYYVVVPLFDGDSEPSWSRWTIGAVDGRVQLVDETGAAAPFEHFVLKADYAGL